MLINTMMEDKKSLDIQLALQKKNQMRISLAFIFIVIPLVGMAQKRGRMTQAQYIEKYNELAVQEMTRTGIPASITLAQGILESGSGNSSLAVKANNHFGIKCHDWKGPSVRHDDDKKNECFRKYKSAERSYKDHSDFLTGRSRYAFLFELKPDDYKGWAKGLKKAGYATSPTYAKALIKVIEDNELYAYDKLALSGGKSTRKRRAGRSEVHTGKRKIHYNNRVKYIVATSEDTYESLSEELYLLNWQLSKYNEKPAGSKLEEGEFVYIQPKRNKIYGPNKSHLVKEGETLYSISQKYAIKVNKLRKINKIPEGREPQVGAMILLRGRLKGKISLQKSNDKESGQENNNEEEPEFEIEFDLGG